MKDNTQVVCLSNISKASNHRYKTVACLMNTTHDWKLVAVLVPLVRQLHIDITAANTGQMVTPLEMVPEPGRDPGAILVYVCAL